MTRSNVVFNYDRGTWYAYSNEVIEIGSPYLSVIVNDMRGIIKSPTLDWYEVGGVSVQKPEDRIEA